MAHNISTGWVVVLAIVAAWDIVWRGMALWRAARQAHTVWFVVLLVLNSAGILPIIYLLTHQKQASPRSR